MPFKHSDAVACFNIPDAQGLIRRARNDSPSVCCYCYSLRLGISAERVRQLANNGELPVARTLEGIRVFDSEDIEKFAAQREGRRKQTSRQKGSKARAQHQVDENEKTPASVEEAR